MDWKFKITEFLKWSVSLWRTSPVAAVILWLAELFVFLAVMFWLSSCSPNFFIQKDNNGSYIKTETTSKIDSTQFNLPINRK